MADPVNMHEAKTELSRLVERALQGEDIVIARAGVPAVRLVPVVSRGARTLGQWKGQIEMSEDFDAPLPDEDLDAWEGRT
jgi:prevent-host-death family protein